MLDLLPACYGMFQTLLSITHYFEHSIFHSIFHTSCMNCFIFLLLIDAHKYVCYISLGTSDRTSTCLHGYYPIVSCAYFNFGLSFARGDDFLVVANSAVNFPGGHDLGSNLGSFYLDSFHPHDFGGFHDIHDTSSKYCYQHVQTRTCLRRNPSDFLAAVS